MFSADCHILPLHRILNPPADEEEIEEHKTTGWNRFLATWWRTSSQLSSRLAASRSAMRGAPSSTRAAACALTPAPALGAWRFHRHGHLQRRDGAAACNSSNDRRPRGPRSRRRRGRLRVYGLGDDTTIRDCCNGLLLLQAGLCGGEPGHTAVGALAALARGDDDNVLDIEEVDRGHFNLDIGRSWRCAVATAVR